MTIRIKPAQIAVGLAIGALFAGGGYALASGRSTSIHGCTNNKTHTLTVQAKCPKGTTALTWSIKGPAGARGATGTPGATGEAGANGSPATVSIGSVSAGSTPAVTNSGSSSNAVLNFTLPQGVTAYGQVWPGASGTSTPAPILKNSNSNVVAVQSGGLAGSYDVVVKGCSTSGQSEPVISVTANQDPNDPNHTGGEPVLATVVSWQTPTSGQYEGDLGFTVSTLDVSDDSYLNSDFSFTVIC